MKRNWLAAGLTAAALIGALVLASPVQAGFWLWGAEGEERPAEPVGEDSFLWDEAPAAEARELPADMARVYYFASGVGGWATDLELGRDWSFRGYFHDSDMGATGPGYPGGTVYICNFSGRFEEPEALGAHSFRLTLAEFQTEQEEGQEYIEDDCLYITSGPYGFEDTQTFTLYMPETPFAEIPEDCMSWVSRLLYGHEEFTALPEDMYLICNDHGSETFIGYAGSVPEWDDIDEDYDGDDFMDDDRDMDDWDEDDDPDDWDEEEDWDFDDFLEDDWDPDAEWDGWTDWDEDPYSEDARAAGGPAAAEEELRQKLGGMVSEEILQVYCDDFDGNGNYELFAVTGESEMSSLWFVSFRELQKLDIPGTCYYWNEDTEHICEVSDGTKVFIMESGGMGSGSTSNCFYVKEDSVLQAENAGEGLAHMSGDEFCIYPSAFDYNIGPDGMGTGHTWKRYYVRWNGSGFDRYIGTEIPLQELLSLQGAEEIIRQAEGLGYSVDTVYRRENGIINVNLHRDENDSRINENLTLRLEGGAVTLVQVQESEDWMARYSFGGVYEP